MEEERMRVSNEETGRDAKKRRRAPTTSNFLKRNPITGEHERLLPQESTWYLIYVKGRPETLRQMVKFRRRFRMRYHVFLESIKMAKTVEWFPGAETAHAAGRAGAPLELLVLGSLRYVGRGWTFDDLEEATGISEERHRRFFHEFITVGSTSMFDKWVYFPKTAEEAANCIHEYDQAGHPGAAFSSDGTHVISEKVPARLKNAHLGAKESHTARAYNMTVNHRRRILNTTRGSPCSWNDKTLSSFDDVLCGIDNGTLLSDVIFELNGYDELGRTVKVKYSGVYAIVDNGYLDRSTLVCLIKYPASHEEDRWSRWIESLRKDVECTFGILKGRFRILKCGIRVHGVQAVDKIWATSCALHNFLLDSDGLDEKWESGVRCDWEGELGKHDLRDVPLIIQRVGASRNTDFSGMGCGGDDRVDSPPFGCDSAAAARGSNVPSAAAPVERGAPPAGDSADAPIPVRSLTLKDFRSRLVVHLDILWKQTKVVWPSRNGKME